MTETCALQVQLTKTVGHSAVAYSLRIQRRLYDESGENMVEVNAMRPRLEQYGIEYVRINFHDS
jgi:hypothetical protein